MKKYIIKNADGSVQHVMQAVHFSRKDAGETLKEYLFKSKEDLNAEDYLSPFDFTLEEVECKCVNEVITDFESAREALGLEHNDGLTVTQRLVGGGAIRLEDVAHLVADINPKHIDALIALNKLFTLAEAWNKEDGFVPDFSDINQDKYFPWFKYIKEDAWFACVRTGNIPVTLGTRLCFKSEERAKQFGMQFADLYNKVFL
jgi:hypothetical protein|nr:MAG TPA: hypothetical protein [Caudoviricetes sp.]